MLTARVLLAPSISTLLMDQHRGHRTEMLEAYAAAARQLEAEQPGRDRRADRALGGSGTVPGRRGPAALDAHRLLRLRRRGALRLPRRARAGEGHRRDGAGGRRARRDRDAGRGQRCDRAPALPGVAAPVPGRARVAGARHGRRSPCLGRRAAAGARRLARARGVRGGRHALAQRPRLEPEARDPEAQAFDGRVLEILKSGAWHELERIERRAHARAMPEANLMHLEVLRGLLGEDLAGRLLARLSITVVGCVDYTCYTFDVANICVITPGADTNCKVACVTGDVNNDLRVTTSDFTAIKNGLDLPFGCTVARRDLDSVGQSAPKTTRRSEVALRTARLWRAERTEEMLIYRRGAFSRRRSLKR